MILIGSRALALRAPALLSRKPEDFDFVCTESEAYDWLDENAIVSAVDREGNKLIVQHEKLEFDLIMPGSSNEMLGSFGSDMVTRFGRVPDLDLLFTIKSSHKYKRNSPHFWKNLQDYHRMKAAGAKIRPEYEAFHKLRETESYNYAHPKLMQGKKSFFDESVKYTFDHDSIHEAVALGDKPAYRYFAKDGEEVYSSRTKFYQQPREIQLNSVVEESAVLAIERSLIPFPGVLDHKTAWRFAFSKVCTSIASGWWRAFAYENAPEILQLYPNGYFERFVWGIASGIVKAA